MIERPILFQGAMVRAILAGTKTQTRRLVKPQTAVSHHYLQPMFGKSPDGHEFGTPGLWREVGPDYPDGPEDDRRCPYGAPGDRLWVREAWGFDSGVRGDFRPLDRQDLSGMDLLTHTLYSADGGEAPRWRPSIHMPRWASRITLEVTSVRAERLQSISDDDAIDEGISREGLSIIRGSARQRFAELWDDINGKRAPWASNPWLWVVSFRRVTNAI